MMPGKVIPISEARRRLPAKVKAKAKVRKLESGAWQRVTAWWSGRTTNGMVLLVGVLAGLVLGIVITSAASSARQANQATAEKASLTGEPTSDSIDYSEYP